jgi:hypothetical protein
MTFKKDDAVKIKYTLLTGVIAGAAVDGTTFEMQYLVQYNDNEGAPQERYFLIEQLEAV